MQNFISHAIHIVYDSWSIVTIYTFKIVCKNLHFTEANLLILNFMYW